MVRADDAAAEKKPPGLTGAEDPEATLAVSVDLPAGAAGWPAVPGFDVLGVIARGGMGSVWRARQHNPPRLVALKVPHDPCPDEFARARFAREVELAASLEHPNIARVYHTDTAGGRCCYAMELIEGVPLDVFVAQNRLGRQEVLRLMAKVCSAVQYAHGRGIIHRDLKPLNVLVTADGEPHVLDFGVAKSLLARPDHLNETAPGALMGTLAYMSPEQAAGDLARTGTRSDVYSLGKMLFRLLTGEHAHSTAGSEYEVRRRIIEEEVRRPRSVDPRLPRELERLLLTALARDPERRYGGAGELGKDIERYLGGRPLVLTESPGTAYVLRKWAWRHRAGLSAAAVLALALCVAGAWVLVRLNTEARKNQAVAGYIRRVLELIDPADPGGRELTLKLLGQAEGELRHFSDQPEVDASVRHAIGHGLQKLGQYEVAQEQFARAYSLRKSVLGGGHADTLASAELLAEAAADRADWAVAERVAREVYDRRYATLAAGDPARVRSATLLAAVLTDLGQLAEAESVCRRAAGEDCGRLPEGAPEVLGLNGKLALILRDRAAADLGEGRPAAAAPRLREAVDLCQRRLARLASDPAGFEAIEATERLASVLSVRNSAGDLQEAERLYESALARARVNERLKANHPEVIIWKSNFARVLVQRDKIPEALAVYREIVPLSERLRGSRHRYTLAILGNYAAVLQKAERWDAAEEQYRALLHLLERGRGGADAEVLLCRRALGSVLMGRGLWAEAAREYRVAYEALEASPSPPKRQVLETAYDLAVAWVCAEELGLAEPLLERVVAEADAVLGAGSRLGGKAARDLEDVRQKRRGAATRPAGGG